MEAYFMQRYIINKTKGNKNTRFFKKITAHRKRFNTLKFPCLFRFPTRLIGHQASRRQLPKADVVFGKVCWRAWNGIRELLGRRSQDGGDHTGRPQLLSSVFIKSSIVQVGSFREQEVKSYHKKYHPASKTTWNQRKDFGINALSSPDSYQDVIGFDRHWGSTR